MNVKLTKRKAWELISRIQPRLNIKQEATPSDVETSRLPPALKGWKSDVKMTGSTTMAGSS